MKASGTRTARSLLVFAMAGGCAAQGGKDWVRGASEPDGFEPHARDAWTSAPEGSGRGGGSAGGPSSPQPGLGPGGEPHEEALAIRESGRSGAGKPGRDDPVWRNTYYDFPSEAAGKKERTVFDATCKSIAEVPIAFHDALCVQGSGRLASGRTVSFARRDCECAALCPRTGQKICFEALDPKLFPSGRGAMGRAITPLRTVAVDSTVVPLGTWMYIPELEGMPRPDGTLHDGCFVAEDRGIKVVGKQVDVFTGDPSVTASWNRLHPSNQGVRVRLNDPRCTRR